MKTIQIMAMLRLQDELNKRINPDWVSADYDWCRAIHVESVELMNHIGWKWWKHQERNPAQVELEMVDIWHFIMSAVISECEGNTQEAGLSMTRAWEVELDDPLGVEGLSDADFAEYIGMAARTGQLMHCLLSFRATMSRLGMSEDKLYTSYVAKNVLNIFRQDHGYKDGTYAKVWAGHEDNEVLVDIMAADPDASPNDLMVALTAAYKLVA